MNAIKQINLASLNDKELETVSNYVLYGKDSTTGESAVDRKEIEIKTKFNSYHKDRCVSLDEMIESPTFDENTLQKNPTIYKKIKPSIDKEKAKNVPGMQQLWTEIDKMAATLAKLEETPNPPPNIKKQIYYMKHHLIELRTQQYYLMDSYFPTFIGKKNKDEYFTEEIEYHMNYPILPRGVMRVQDEEEFKFPRLIRFGSEQPKLYTDEEVQEMERQRKPFFDFRKPTHIYQLIQHYAEIQDFVKDMPDSPLNNLLWTLDFYIEKANLSPQQLLIVRDKKLRFQNKQIVQHLHDELGIYHQENYVSTIWNKVTRLIAEAVELNYDEYLCRDYNKAWKTCSRCGRKLLRDPRNYVRKAKATDGLTGRCKLCDKEIRQMSKPHKVQVQVQVQI